VKRLFSWQVIVGLILIALSLFFYEVDYLVFRDARHIVQYFFTDLAFVFVEVLLVTLVLHQLLSYREKKMLMKKLNMVIGAFFVEAGTDLIRSVRAFDAGADEISRHLVVDNSWTDKEFRRMHANVSAYVCTIDFQRGDIAGLKDLLLRKRQFMLGLLENANLLEHESFTNLLWAVFHLAEELSNRKGLDTLPQTDREHIAGDIKRSYTLLISEWLAYMAHLKSDYPYLFSLAMRTNPFDAGASVIVR